MQFDDDAELLNEFAIEAKENLSVVETDLLELEREKDNLDSDRVDRLFRGIHSIKGAASFLGLVQITDLSHVMETLLDRIRTGSIKPESNIVDALFEGTDLLGTMLDDIAKSNDVTIQETHDLIVQLLTTTSPPETGDEEATTIQPDAVAKHPAEAIASSLPRTCRSSGNWSRDIFNQKITT